VTGANGFVASWLVKRLVELGLTVHATVREANRTEKTQHLIALGEQGPGQVVLFSADLLKPGSFDDAIVGCGTVFHTASPFILNIEDPHRDLLDPAVKGTQNLLNSVNSCATVKRVVLTSSVAAIFGDNQDCAQSEGGVLTERDWNTTSSASHQPYNYSKTLAEQAAWDMVKAQNQWDLVSVNPALVIGPTLGGHSTSATHDLLRQLGDGRMKPGAPPYEVGMVDVRDVAEAHVRAAFLPNANGRYIVFNEACSILGLAECLRDRFTDYPLPKRELPKWVVWLVGPILDKTITRLFASRNLGIPWRADNSRGVKELGLSYRALKGSAEEMFQQMIDLGVVSK